MLRLETPVPLIGFGPDANGLEKEGTCKSKLRTARAVISPKRARVLRYVSHLSAPLMTAWGIREVFGEDHVA